MGCEGMYPRCRGGDDSDGPSEDQGRGRHFAPSRSPLVVAMRPKELFECIVGPGQGRHLITVKEARPVTLRDFTEVRQRRREGASVGLVPGQCAEHAAETALDGVASTL